MTLFDKSQKNFARLSSKIDSEKFILSSGVDFDGENFDSVLKPVKSDSKENEKKNKVKKAQKPLNKTLIFLFNMWLK